MNKNGRLTTCDYPGCKEWCFCKATGTGEADGRYTRWNNFEAYPDGWESFHDNKKRFYAMS